ncbi:Na+/H+ antiporter NhaC family protein [Thalassotalea mangrovi]|uniref:Sodium:proton antiporter n=1 Tax=Thalassotalea mangrovi TaxID=2572245 RepID=A0A4U1B395_9GAMM|nr:Na+/H+ antiporter NhaC family protein [Thalassotalea mangrovi]TKB43566.1 sodium:proton antiporter [Thalassotalea mangrovi]
MVLWKKEVILALLVAICCSELLMLFAQTGTGESLLTFSIASVERVVAVFQSEGNTRILVFSLLVGALLAFMRESGGVTATVNFLIRKGISGSARRSRFLAFFTGVIIFIESNLSVLMAGIISRGLFDKFEMSRARLAYIIDSTSAPICILLLLNGWGAYVLGLLGNYELNESLVSILIATIPLNFYALITLAVVVYTIWADKTHGPLKQAELQQQRTHKHLDLDVEPSKPSFMLVPLLTMSFSMVLFMFVTGDGNFTQGSGSKSVLYATVLACVVSYVMMVGSKRFKHIEMTKIGFNGMSELLPLVCIVLFSLALGSSLKELGTGAFISGLVAENLPLFLVPAMLFIAGGLMSFTTGTSWGTFALLIPIGMPLVINLDLPAPLLLAAILGGGVFGDHCSPISDTTAVSAVASGCDLLEHVRTQLPYALFAGGLTVLAYIATGMMVIGV